MSELLDQILKTNLALMDLELIQYYNSPEFTQAMILHGKEQNSDETLTKEEIENQQNEFIKRITEYKEHLTEKIK